MWEKTDLESAIVGFVEKAASDLEHSNRYENQFTAERKALDTLQVLETADRAVAGLAKLDATAANRMRALVAFQKARAYVVARGHIASAIGGAEFKARFNKYGKQAQKVLGETGQLESSDPGLWFNLGVTAWSVDAMAQTVPALQKAAELAGDGELRNKALRILFEIDAEPR
jgi:hypothetical protein